MVVDFENDIWERSLEDIGAKEAEKIWGKEKISQYFENRQGKAQNKLKRATLSTLALKTTKGREVAMAKLRKSIFGMDKEEEGKISGFDNWSPEAQQFLRDFHEKHGSSETWLFIEEMKRNKKYTNQDIEALIQNQKRAGYLEGSDEIVFLRAEKRLREILNPNPAIEGDIIFDESNKTETQGFPDLEFEEGEFEIIENENALTLHQNVKVEMVKEPETILITEEEIMQKIAGIFNKYPNSRDLAIKIMPLLRNGVVNKDTIYKVGFMFADFPEKKDRDNLKLILEEIFSLREEYEIF